MINFKTELLKQEANVGTFALEPLESGFGHTVGNCLRRVLLSRLEGAAITSIKMDGASHQFSTIPGIAEDVIQMILNLKKVRLKIFSEKAIKLTIKASGKCEVKARDIDTYGAGEVVNPDLHIASLTTPSAKLHIEMMAEKGVGYTVADDKKVEEIGVMPIDSIYTPVLSVNYKVEPARVGRASNYDKLILEITTDGTMEPKDALDQASRILSNYFRQIFDPTLDEVVVAAVSVNDGVMKMSVEELDLPVRITNALRAIEVDTVEKLITTPHSQLLKAKNLGVQSLTLISQKLAERNLSLSEA